MAQLPCVDGWMQAYVVKRFEKQLLHIVMSNRYTDVFKMSHAWTKKRISETVLIYMWCVVYISTCMCGSLCRLWSDIIMCRYIEQIFIYKMIYLFQYMRTTASSPHSYAAFQ